MADSEFPKVVSRIRQQLSDLAAEIASLENRIEQRTISRRNRLITRPPTVSSIPPAPAAKLTESASNDERTTIRPAHVPRGAR
jgi:hypothetical protein